jgi:phosphomevalonate kinase
VVFEDEIQWQVYPNPSAGVYNFVYQVNPGETMKIKVYDVNGKLVKQMNPSGNGFVQKMVIDIKSSDYPSGIYLLIADSGDKKQTVRLIKQ